MTLGRAGALLAAANGLGEAAARSGRGFGFSIDPSYASEAPVSALLARHATVITPEMAWHQMVPARLDLASSASFVKARCQPTAALSSPWHGCQLMQCVPD